MKMSDKRGRPSGVTNESSLEAATPEFKEVRRIARELGVSMARLAQMANVPLATINRWKVSFSGTNKSRAYLDSVRGLVKAPQA